MMWNFLRDEQGQDLIEYTLLLAFVPLPPRRCSSRPAAVSAGSGAWPTAG